MGGEREGSRLYWDEAEYSDPKFVENQMLISDDQSGSLGGLGSGVRCLFRATSG